MVPYSDAPPCEEVVDEQLLRIAMRRHVKSKIMAEFRRPPAIEGRVANRDRIEEDMS